MQSASTTLGSDPAFDAARSALQRSPPQRTGLWLILSLALFVATQLDQADPVGGLATLVGVLLFHEAGHYVAMRAFGYRDVRMFFIPFFGAAVTARPSGVAAWKEAVALLAGPLPGILLGCVLAVASHEPTVRQITVSLLWINGANLMPLGGLDGGQFARRVVFSRQRHLEIAFLAITGIVLGTLAISLKLWLLGVFACLGLVALPFRNRVRTAAQSLRPALGDAADPMKLPDEGARLLFETSRTLLGARAAGKPQLVASVMDQVFEATRPAPSAAASIGLGLVWLGGLLGVGLGGVLTVAGAAPKYWHDQALTSAGAVVSMPYKPTELPPFAVAGWKAAGGLKSGVSHKYEVMAWTRDGGSISQALESVWKNLAPTSMESGAPIESAGMQGREAEFQVEKSTCKLRVLGDAEHLFALSACAAASEPEMSSPPTLPTGHPPRAARTTCARRPQTPASRPRAAPGCSPAGPSAPTSGPSCPAPTGTRGPPFGPCFTYAPPFGPCFTYARRRRPHSAIEPVGPDLVRLVTTPGLVPTEERAVCSAPMQRVTHSMHEPRTPRRRAEATPKARATRRTKPDETAER